MALSRGRAASPGEDCDGGSEGEDEHLRVGCVRGKQRTTCTTLVLSLEHAKGVRTFKSDSGSSMDPTK